MVALTADTTGRLESIQQMVQSCIQCGTCTASCPNEFAMDLTPRRLWRMVIMGLEDDIFQSKTFSLCSSCYTCTLRCPRGLPLTAAMSALKQMAFTRGLARYRAGNLFYGNFLSSVRHHGRVREMAFMTGYFAQMKNPLLPLRFASLGMKLMSRGKVTLPMPSRGNGKLERLFRKVEKIQQDEISGEVR
jgi:heterodisulfide reductase subunit C